MGRPDHSRKVLARESTRVAGRESCERQDRKVRAGRVGVAKVGGRQPPEGRLLAQARLLRW